MAEEFVRLTKRLSGRTIVDPVSTWSIAGLDVQPVPDKKKYPNAYRFVRDKINRGALEYASQAEYDEVEEVKDQSRQQFDERLQQLASLGLSPSLAGFAVHQEGAVQAAAREQREALGEAQGGTGEEDRDYQSMTNDALRSELEDRKLETSGNKAQLIERLTEDDGGSSDEE